MSGECGHGELEFLGREKTEKGYNEYFRCKRCGAVVIFSAAGKVYQVKGGR